MKNTFKRLFAVLLTLVMYCSMAMSALAAETAPDGTIWYGNDLAVQIEAGKDGYTFRSVYVSPRNAYEMSNHMVSHNGGVNNDIPQTLVMVDTSTNYTWTPNGLYSYGNSNYEVMYCCDAETPYNDGIYYKRVNLEDSNYYSEDEAKYIRAIVANSYPFVSLEEMKKGLEEAGFAGAKDLTRAEVITAVQAAIWAYANTDVGEYYYSQTFDVPTNSQWGGTIHDFTNEMDVWWQTGKRKFSKDETVAARINALIDHLKALEPVEAEKEQIIISKIQVVDTAPAKDTEGLYNVNLKVLLNNSGSSELDEIKLDIYVDGQLVKTEPIMFGTEEYAFTVQAKLGQTIKAVVSGVQDVPKGVYFYEPEGGRDVSQCLVGVASGKTDVYAEASVVVFERVFKFHKTTKIGEGTEAVTYPLEGIEFDIYYLCSVEEFNAALENGETKYENPSLALVAGQTPITTVKTDKAGNAIYNLTANGNPDGIYLIAEREHDAVIKALDPFMVAIPMADENGNPVYTIELNPKNDIVRPDVDKDVTEIGQKDDGADMGETVTWIVRGDIPKDLGKAKSYVLADTLDYRLTYTDGLVVKVEKIVDEADNCAEGENILVAAEDYELTVADITVDVMKGDKVEAEATKKIVVKLTESGRAKIMEMVGAEYDQYELRVYFNTIIDEDAAMGEAIPNDATLEYINSANFKWVVLPEKKPEVYTTGIHVHKYDAKDANKALPGAVFKLAEVVEKDTIGAVPLVIKNAEDKIESVYVVYKEFYIDAACTTKANTVTTNDAGNALLYGLEAGTYYLVETKAPVGYNLLSYPVRVSLDKTSHVTVDKEETTDVNEDRTVYVANSNTFVLPETGGIGTAIFTLAGSLMMGGAGVMLVGKKKEEE